MEDKTVLEVLREIEQALMEEYDFKSEVLNRLDEEIKAETNFYSILCPSKTEFKDSDSIQPECVFQSPQNLFHCPICDKKFIKSSYLRKHEKTHTNEKPFNCSTCDKSLKGSGDLKKNMRRPTQMRNLLNVQSVIKYFQVLAI